jgi:HAD superfamily hydrolase (TIGR01509 family)
VTLGAEPELPRTRPRPRRGRSSFALPGEFRAILFDLDGLLIDSEPLWGRAEEAVVEEHRGRLSEADRVATIGRSIEASLEIHADRLGLPGSAVPGLIADVLGRMRILVATEASIRPGAAELVGRLAGRVPLGLASNSDRDLVDLALDRIGLAGRFATVVCAAEVAAAKPEPDVYLEACRRLSIDPTDAIGFEDSPAGVVALRAAGLASVGVRADGPFALDGADVVVDWLSDVLGWIA